MGLNSAIEALRDSKPKVYPKDKVGKWLIDLKADWINANTWRVLTERYKLQVQRSRPPVHYKIHYRTEEIRLSINMTDKHSPLLTWIKNDIKKTRQEMTIEDIIKAITEEFGVSRELLLSRDRHRFVSETRQIAFWFAYRYLSMSAESVGKHFGRGHMTVFRGIKVVTARIKNERGFYELIKAVKQRLEIE